MSETQKQHQQTTSTPPKPNTDKDALSKKGAVETQVTQHSRPPLEELEELTDEEDTGQRSQHPQPNEAADSYDPTDEITPG